MKRNVAFLMKDVAFLALPDSDYIKGSSWAWTAATWRSACLVESAADLRRSWADVCMSATQPEWHRAEKGASDGDLNAR